MAFMGSDTPSLQIFNVVIPCMISYTPRASYELCHTDLYPSQANKYLDFMIFIAIDILIHLTITSYHPPSTIFVNIILT